MRLEEGKYSIAELVDWYHKRELVANNEYQRGGRIWPPAAKSYFIDTILKDFPFPRIYFHEILDAKIRRPRREIVDGQQRVSTIVDFVDGVFALGKNAIGWEGKRFRDLTQEQQDAFLFYSVSVGVIRNAARSDILQMFRRMNGFTLPLNAAEKRHSEFFGEFKDWVNITLDKFGSLLIDWRILTSRQVVRMADAELIADIALAIEDGIVSTSPAKLHSLYHKYDNAFSARQEMDTRISESLDFVLSHLSALRDTFITKPHVFHSLICALIHNKFGLNGADMVTRLASIGTFANDVGIAIASLTRLAAAHEEKDVSEFHEYVQSASEGGNRAAQRAVRVKWLCRALRGELV